MKKILIFGGAGFIGSQLTLNYLKKGDHVTVIDDCSNALERKIYYFKTFTNYTFINNKVEKILDIKLPKNNYDVIYHLASESRPLMFGQKYDRIISSNVTGLLNIVQYIKGYSPDSKLVYASTSEIYGENDNELKEDMSAVINTKYPRNVYAISKMLAESILQNNLNINWNIVRFFNAYGPENRDDDTKVIPSIIHAIKNKETFKICGTGEQTRSFTYIDDIINGLNLISTSKQKNETYNLGMNEAFSINELVDFVKKYKELDVVYIPERKGEPFNRLTDCHKAKEELNWCPDFTLDAGLKEIFKTI